MFTWVPAYFTAEFIYGKEYDFAQGLQLVLGTGPLIMLNVIVETKPDISVTELPQVILMMHHLILPLRLFYSTLGNS